MADISMCSGEGCPKKKMCYRYTAPKNEYWQTYFTNPPIKENGECDSFWKNNKEDADKPKEP